MHFTAEKKNKDLILAWAGIQVVYIGMTILLLLYDTPACSMNFIFVIIIQLSIYSFLTRNIACLDSKHFHSHLVMQLFCLLSPIQFLLIHGQLTSCGLASPTITRNRWVPGVQERQTLASWRTSSQHSSPSTPSKVRGENISTHTLAASHKVQECMLDQQWFSLHGHCTQYLCNVPLYKCLSCLQHTTQCTLKVYLQLPSFPGPCQAFSRLQVTEHWQG